MPETVKMLLTLTIIAGLAGLGLAAMNRSTTPLIEENERQFTLRSINRVVPDAPAHDQDPCLKAEPGFDNTPNQDAVCVGGHRIYRARKGDEVVGLAVEAIGDQAYSGTILNLVGITLDGVVTGVEVLRHAETPGLGSLITDCVWRKQFVGKGPKDMVWKVTKDGGDVDQLAGATISSRSMIDAILKAQQVVAEHKDEILSAEPAGEGEVCDAS